MGFERTHTPNAQARRQASTTSRTHAASPYARSSVSVRAIEAAIAADRRATRRRNLVALLALLVVACTALVLMVPAISATQAALDGDQEALQVEALEFKVDEEPVAGEDESLSSEDAPAEDANNADNQTAEDDYDEAEPPSSDAAEREESSPSSEKDAEGQNHITSGEDDDAVSESVVAAVEGEESEVGESLRSAEEADDPESTGGNVDATGGDESPRQGDETVSDYATSVHKSGRNLAFIYEDDTLKASATVLASSGIPADAELIVTPITPATDGYNYDAYMEALCSDGAAPGDFTAKNTLFYDIAIMRDGLEYEPGAGEVDISFVFKGNQLEKLLGVDDATDLYIVHLPIAEKVRDRFSSTRDAIAIGSDDINPEYIAADSPQGRGEFSFTVESLSTISVTNTSPVDLTISSSMPEGNTYIAAISGPNYFRKLVELPASGTANVTLNYVGEYKLDIYTAKTGQEGNCANDVRNNDYNNLVQNHATQLEEGSLLFGGYLLNIDDITISDAKGSASVNLTLPQSTTSMGFSELMDHASAYGVVAPKFTSGAQSRTNFATKELVEMRNQSEGRFGARVTSDDPIPFIAGQINGVASGQSFNMRHSADYYVTADGERFISTSSDNEVAVIRDKEEIDDKVDLLITRALNQAKTLSDKSTKNYNMASVGRLADLNGPDRVVDVTAYPDDATIVLDATDLASRECLDMTIRKKPGQTIVFNLYGDTVYVPNKTKMVEVTFNDDGSVKSEKTYSAEDMDDGHDGDGAQNRLTPETGAAWSKVIWNIPDASTINTPSGSIAGVFLIQSGASFTTNKGGGWIVSNGPVENRNEWYAFPGKDEPFETITVVKVFQGVDSVADIVDRDDYYLLLETYANAQSGGTSHQGNGYRFVIKDNADTANGEIKYTGTPKVDAANRTVTYTWQSGYLAVGNEHKLTEFNAKAKPSGSSAAIDPIRVQYQTRIINLDNSVMPHVVRWHDNPEKDADNPDGNVSGKIADAYGVLNVSNDPQNNTATVTNYYQDRTEYDLTVVKKVRGTEDPEGAEYRFTVELADEAGTVPAGDVSFAYTKSDGTSGNLAFAHSNGKLQAAFTLKKDESITLGDIPKGWRYNVYETAGEGYTTTYSTAGAASASGTMTWDATETVTNVYQQKMGKLVVKKVVNDASILPAGFRVNLVDIDNAEYSRELGIADASILVETGKTTYTWTVSDIPQGDTVRVGESGWAVDGYAMAATISINGADARTVTSADELVLGADGDTVMLENVYEPIIALKKIVRGTPSDGVSAYSFNIKVWKPDGSLMDSTIETLSGQTLEFGSDGYEIDLANGENVAFVLDQGCEYSIVETTEGDFETSIDREVLGTHEAIAGQVVDRTEFTRPTQIEYTNAYTDHEASLHAKKVYQDEDGTRLGLKGGDFQFAVQTWDPDAKAPGETVKTGSNAISGNVYFEGIEFPMGTSWYLITERKPANPDSTISYSEERYLAKVEVPEANTASMVRATAKPGQSVTLAGTFYADSPGTYRILASKTNAWSAYHDIAGNAGWNEFEFELGGVNQGDYTYYIARVDGWTVKEVVATVTLKISSVDYDPGTRQNTANVGSVTIEQSGVGSGGSSVGVSGNSSTEAFAITYYELGVNNAIGDPVAVPTFTNVKKSAGAKVAIAKTNQDGGKPLPGAKFSLVSAEGAAVALGSDTTDGKGMLQLGELAAGTYYLTELSAPDGYILLDKRIRIVVANGAVSSAQAEDATTRYAVAIDNAGTYVITVPNNEGIELPSTGGMGTGMLAFAGVLLVALAGALLVARRRLHAR